MTSDTPGHAVELLDRAFNEGDLDAVLTFYEAAAVVVTEPGKLARGREELRNFFDRVMRAGASAKQLKTHVIEADGLALFLSRLDPPYRERKSGCHFSDLCGDNRIPQADGRDLEGAHRQSSRSTGPGTRMNGTSHKAKAPGKFHFW